MPSSVMAKLLSLTLLQTTGSAGLGDLWSRGGTCESHPQSGHTLKASITLVGQDLLFHLHLQPDSVTCSGFWERAEKVLKAELG